jgi:hypothetical protein
VLRGCKFFFEIGQEVNDYSAFLNKRHLVLHIGLNISISQIYQNILVLWKLDGN